MELKIGFGSSDQVAPRRGALGASRKQYFILARISFRLLPVAETTLSLSRHVCICKNQCRHFLGKCHDIDKQNDCLISETGAAAALRLKFECRY